MRTLTGYLLLVLALASLVGPALLLLGIAIGLNVRITEPPLLFVGGLLITALSFWGAKVLLSPEPSRN